MLDNPKDSKNDLLSGHDGKLKFQQKSLLRLDAKRGMDEEDEDEVATWKRRRMMAMQWLVCRR